MSRGRGEGEGEGRALLYEWDDDVDRGPRDAVVDATKDTFGEVGGEARQLQRVPQSSRELELGLAAAAARKRLHVRQAGGVGRRLERRVLRLELPLARPAAREEGAEDVAVVVEAARRVVHLLLCVIATGSLLRAHLPHIYDATTAPNSAGRSRRRRRRLQRRP